MACEPGQYQYLRPTIESGALAAVAVMIEETHLGGLLRAGVRLWNILSKHGMGG
jgi:hypothetical protein